MSLADMPVEGTELLARAIHSERHVRKADETIRAEAFLPFSRVELSVIRHRALEPPEVWEVCHHVAGLRQKPLIGRADIFANDARSQALEVVPNEGEGIPRNHADIVGWPSEKPAQMMKAVVLASRAKFSICEVPLD